MFKKLFKGRLRTNVLEAIPFWIASVITGLIAVAYTKLFNLAEELMHSARGWHGWILFILTPVSFLISWFIVLAIAPYARGSGIPQVMAAIEMNGPGDEKKISRLLSPRVIVAKIISSLFMVVGGGAVGREGPTIQIAGSVFRWVSKHIPMSWPRLAERSFTLTGAAAGLAAAFNTPLGGIVFAIEELAKIHIRFFRTALFTAVIIAGLTAQGLLGPYLYLGYPDVQKLTASIFFGVATVAILSGWLGSLMGKAILIVMKWKQQFTRDQTIIFIISTGLVVAAIAFFLNDQVLGSGKNLMNHSLFSADKSISTSTLLLRIIGPVLSFNIGGAGGIFAPALAAGASVGAWVADVANVIGPNANILILSGMVGFLTGVTRTPFTSAILVLEMTDRHNVIFHLMLAAMLANFAAVMIEKHSFYDQLKKNYLKELH